MTASLGDLTQIPVSTNPTQGLPALGDVQVTLYNQDITNLVYVSYQAWFKAGAFNSIPIQPLTSITISAKRAIYVAATVAGVAPLMVLPEGSQANPSPAQIAAQINTLGLATAGNQVAGTAAINNPAYGPSTLARQITQETNIPDNIAATGVPLLNLKSATTLANAQAIAAGATFNCPAVLGINQPAYNLHVTATAGAGSTKGYYQVSVKWVDTASGYVVQFDQYVAWMSASTVPNTLTTVIYGPTDADQVQVSITNLDSIAMTVNTAFIIISSRANYSTDSIYQFWPAGGNMPGVPNFQIAASQPAPTQRIIFSLTRSLGAGVTTTPDYALPVYAGNVYVFFRGTGSNNWNVYMIDQFSGLVTIQAFNLSSGNNASALMILPRSPITLNIQNGGSVSGTLWLEIIGV